MAAFHEWSPLYVYLNTTSAKNAKASVNYDLRYMGQTVAVLKGNKNHKHTLDTRNYEEKNKRDFGCDKHLASADWRGKEVAEFRDIFVKRKDPRQNSNNKCNQEHRLQSLLLTEFSKNKNKALRGIQPVSIGGARFPMPTPINASKHQKEEYCTGLTGGGIDILARTGKGGKATHLCVMELKDENTKREPPREVMGQALAYATFIHELLRSTCGSKWWNLFGFKGEVPKRLVLYAVCVMPSTDNDDKSFGGERLDFDGDIIELHYLYFSEDNKGLSEKYNRILIEPGDTSLGS